MRHIYLSQFISDYLFPPILSRSFFPAYYFALVVSRQLDSRLLFLANFFPLVLSRKLLSRSISPANFFPAYSFPLVLPAHFSCKFFPAFPANSFPACSFPPTPFPLILQVLYKTT
jgi:hypothetical protein